MKETILGLFHENGIDKVKEYTIDHHEPESVEARKKVTADIQEMFRDYKGVYVYLDQKGDPLYVGMGILSERVRFHYYESFGKYSGRGCERHIKFFTQFQGPVTILWGVAEDKAEQRRIKRNLLELLEPKYNWMKQEGLLEQ